VRGPCWRARTASTWSACGCCMGGSRPRLPRERSLGIVQRVGAVETGLVACQSVPGRLETAWLVKRLPLQPLPLQTQQSISHPHSATWLTNPHFLIDRYVRLEAMEGVVAFHGGDREAAARHLKAAQERLQKLQVGWLFWFVVLVG